MDRYKQCIEYLRNLFSIQVCFVEGESLPFGDFLSIYASDPQV